MLEEEATMLNTVHMPGKLLTAREYQQIHLVIYAGDAQSKNVCRSNSPEQCLG
jgi:hypothetical protein